MAQRLLVVFPSNLAHQGLSLKLQGQLEGFSKRYDVRLCALDYNPSGSFLYKVFYTIWFHFHVMLGVLLAHKVYCRYNPKIPVLLVYLMLMSWVKTVYVEHNTFYDLELKVLGRRFEAWMDVVLRFLMRFSRLYQVGVTREIAQRFVDAGFSRTRVVMNGYRKPAVDDSQVDTAIVETVKDFAKQFDRLAVFVGNGYVWHGVDRILDVMKDYPKVGVVLIGPFDIENVSSDVLKLGRLNSDTVSEVLGCCDVGINSFASDVKGLTEVSSLKTREYLCHGLSVVVNERDNVMDFDVLQPFVLNYSQEPDRLNSFLYQELDRTQVSRLACECLAWDSILKDL